MTVPAPSVCATCDGTGFVRTYQPCPDCGCSCGRGPMRVGLMCEACHEEIDDQPRKVAR